MDKFYFAETIDDIFSNITGTKCPMCEDVQCDSNSLLKHHFDMKHFKHSIFYEVDGKQACILPCRKECGYFRRSLQEKKRPHFHCPFCEQMYGRSSSFKHHLLKMQGNCAKSNGESMPTIPQHAVTHNKAFVQEVAKYEELFNPSIPEYSNKNIQARAWACVSNAMNEDEASCVARWKKLKNNYLQYVRACEKHLDPPGHYLSEHMKFLLPYADIQEPDLPTPQRTVEIVTDVELDHLDETAFEESDGEKSPTRQDNIQWKRKSYHFVDDDDDDGDQEFSDYEQSPPKKSKVKFVDSEDPDTLFFKSILPDVQKMDHRQKNRFRRITLGVIEDVLYGSISSSSLSSAIPEVKDKESSFI